MRHLGRSGRARLFIGASAAAVLCFSSAAHAQDKTPITIAPQSLASALYEFGGKTGRQVIFPSSLATAKQSGGVAGESNERLALTQLLAGTGLTFRREDDVFVIVQQEGGSGPQSGSAAGGGAEVEALIVTAQKREEDIQDVPIAISAFSQKDLENRQVAGGPDLITQVPNMSFTKTNFTSYSIQIRGIGTQAISATTDPAVAVAFNNTPFIRNRFFEQEFYDLERLEVLRGPQGTLYGRNATAGVVNLISTKPKFVAEAKGSLDLGNYNSRRIEGMLNIPLVEDVVALRLAGAWTKRDGYAFNEFTGEQIDGRDLWSTRLSLRFEPTDWISANLIWEHFEEDDDRLRSGKQLCKKHVVTHVGGIPVPPGGGSGQSVGAYVAQGCTAVSLYSEEAFQTPNGNSLPYYAPLADIALPVFASIDPYASATQSLDLRVIESSVEPDYRASADIGELQVSIDLSDNLTLDSETAYSTDSLFSLQDFNRFTTTSGTFDPNNLQAGANNPVDDNGFYCDPQLGCADRLLLVDLSTSDSSQFSQEFRLGSDFDGPLNFSLGVNYLRHDAEDKYYVFINTLSMWADLSAAGSSGSCSGRPGQQGETAQFANPELIHAVQCPYLDPNPIGALNDQGRNYFLSKNPYKLISYAAFGELYYQITPDLKLTGGLRFTVDKKTAPQIPSWLLAGPVIGSGAVGPYPTTETLVQEWREPTGRLALDWKPDLSFTDETLVYASYAHGYKAGGANPPPPVFSTYGSPDAAGPPIEILPDTFGPEFVDAFELGMKNTLFDGLLTLNLTGFYYDYKGYQTSEIRNRSAVNSNYDAEVWGAELEADWRVSEALRLGFKGGYNGTRIGDDQSAIDLMDRTAGNPDWMVYRPFPTIPSNCILPIDVVTAGGIIHAGGQASGSGITSWNGLCVDAYYLNRDPITLLPYVENPTVWRTSLGGPIVALPAAYADYAGFDPQSAPNGGKGFSKDLGGNELPNAPRYTATVTADYTLPLAGEWLMTLHGDYHYQSQSWGRIFNSDPYDRIEGFSTVNAAAIFTNDDAGWKVMAYVKNVFDETAITGTFLNSDDTGLTTNVFLTEPRLYGIRVTKDWTGGSFFGMGDGPHTPGTPYLFQVEVGGMMSRFDRSVEPYTPDWITPAIASSPAVQDNDLDWGDVRDIKLTYAPANGWRISGAYRFGKTNVSDRGAAYEEVTPGLIKNGARVGQLLERDNHAITAVRGSEEYSVADFMVGREVGLGAFGEGGKSAVSAGLRYANFESTSHVAMDGIVDSYIAPAIGLKYGVQRYEAFTTSLDSVREFEGAGPALSWDASVRLWGDDETGHADFDWSIGGAVLYGKQSNDSSEDRWGQYIRLTGLGLGPLPVRTTLYNQTDVPRHRTEKVTVPNLTLSLGLSYSVDRVKVSTGYSYDRFFDAIDGGVEEGQQHDRTIHGPYLKLSVGFGG
jgi:iron complex outermembrane receptor protein